MSSTEKGFSRRDSWRCRNDSISLKVAAVVKIIGSVLRTGLLRICCITSVPDISPPNRQSIISNSMGDCALVVIGSSARRHSLVSG